jgi:hypothetical protein
MGGMACPKVYDHALGKARPMAECDRRSGVVKEAKCDREKDEWCVPGVVAYRPHEGPAIVTYTGERLCRVVPSMYQAKLCRAAPCLCALHVECR